MEYEHIERSGRLDIDYIGKNLDLYSLGVLQLNFQEILDKVAFKMLSDAGLIKPLRGRYRNLDKYYHSVYRRIIRAEISHVKSGSFIESIMIYVAAVLADPDVRAVLQNIIANIIWAISTSRVKGVAAPPETIKEKDPFDIGPNLRDIILAIASNNGGHPCEIRIWHRTVEGEDRHVTILINRNEKK